MNALELDWVFGINQDIPNGFHNLTDDNGRNIFYVSANNGVIYDYQNRTQRLLQGHRKEITANCVSSDRKWIATGDAGEDSMIVVWETATGIPIKNIFNPHGGLGTVSLAMSSDSKFLYSISVGMPQTLAIWDWSTPSQDPLFEIEIDSPDFQTCLKVNLDDNYELLTNGQESVYFYLWSRETGVEQITPNMHLKEFNVASPYFTESIFVQGTSQAISGTVDGQIVLWDQKELSNISVKAEKGHRSAIKYIRIHNSAITCLQNAYGNFVITGGDEGSIRIFDTKLKIFVQLEKLRKGPVSYISVSNYSNLQNQDKRLEFMMVSKNGSIYLADEITEMTKTPTLSLVMQHQPNGVFALDAHPSKPWLIIGGADGTLNLWDYETKEKLGQRQINQASFSQAASGQPATTGGMAAAPSPTSATTETTYCFKALRFSTDGSTIAAGFTNGVVMFLDAETLQELGRSTFNVSKSASIEHLVFSYDMRYCACYDSDNAVALFSNSEVVNKGTWLNKSPDGNNSNRQQQQNYSNNSNIGWIYVGKYRVHSKRITSLIFSPAPVASEDDKGSVSSSQGLYVLRLLSFSEDRHVVEYNLSESITGLVIKERKQLEQTAAITGATWFFPDWNHNEKYILISNSEFKFRLFRADSFMCRYTFLCPTYGGPLRNIMILSSKIQVSAQKTVVNNYLFYTTDEKIIGLVKCPIDGNPYRTIGVIAHPQMIAANACSYDGKHVFIAGGKDYTVTKWNMHTDILEMQAVSGGQGHEPFINLLEGGKEGNLFRQIEDLFYYSQLKTQGLNTQKARVASNVVNVSQVPLIFQALGYFPSEFEVQNIINEIKYSKVLESGSIRETITLEELITIYVNHRPVINADLEHTSIIQVLKDAISYGGGGGQGYDPTILKTELINLLQNYGEFMNANEFNETVALVLQHLDPALEKGNIILPAPDPVPETIDLNKVIKSMKPKPDLEYMGSLDIEERGEEAALTMQYLTQKKKIQQEESKSDSTKGASSQSIKGPNPVLIVEGPPSEKKRSFAAK